MGHEDNTPPQPDPALVAQEAAAKAADQRQIQNSLAQDTSNLWAMFGGNQQPFSYISAPAPAQPGKS